RGYQEDRAADVCPELGRRVAHRGVPAGFASPRTGSGEQEDRDDGEAGPPDDRDRRAAWECPRVREVDVQDEQQHEHQGYDPDDEPAGQCIEVIAPEAALRRALGVEVAAEVTDAGG